MSPLRQFQQRHAAAKDELGALVAKYGAGEWPEADNQRGEELEAECARLTVSERRQALADDETRIAVGRPLDGNGSSGLEVRAFADGPSAVPSDFDGAILRAQDGTRVPLLQHRHRIAAFLPPTESRASELGLGGFLRALHNGPQSELERRVLGEAAVGTGAAMVPGPLSSEIIDLLRARSVAFQAGVRTIPMTSQTLKFARVLTDPQGTWRAENATITVADPSFDAVTLTARSWALIVVVSRELLEDGQNVDVQLRDQFARAGALALDQAVLGGNGVPPTPLGIANSPGIATLLMGPNGANFGTYSGTGGSYVALLDATLALDNNNAGTITGMILAPRTARYMAGLVDGMGQPMRMPDRLAAIPQLVSTSMSVAEVQGTSSNASSILLGDFSQVFVGMRTALQVSVLSERYADKGQVGFVIWMRADVVCARPAAICRIQGIIP